MKANNNTRTLTEGAICIALALVLGLVAELDAPWAYGGSIGITMVPLLVFAVHRGGVGWGVLAGLVFGTLKFFIGGHSFTWESILLDYSIAYGLLGFAGAFRGRLGLKGYALGALTGGVLRFAAHWLSGVTFWAEYAEGAYLSVKTPSVGLYSLVYNGAYMLPNIVLAVILVPLLGAALSKIKDKA
ncbi:MAG: energy-coupled thiamine transporter ThiT [Oscillospiraceae bacterium]|jgi:thiamine transporter|nr:energy-coupled thiamine transporter ThiT [Oscillospiraceae bacterium]